MTEFRDFTPYFLGDVQGCPRSEAEIMVLRVLVEFLEYTLVLEHDAQSINIIEDKHTYTPVFPNDRYRAVSIQKARLVNDSGVTQSELSITHWDDMENLVGAEWDRQTSGSDPNRIILTLDNKFRVYPIPENDSDNTLEVHCAVTIKRTATEIDDFIFENFVEDIANGCRAKLMFQDNKSWTSPTATRYEAEYWQGIRNARKQTLGGKGETSGYVKPRSFMNMFGG